MKIAWIDSGEFIGTVANNNNDEKKITQALKTIHTLLIKTWLIIKTDTYEYASTDTLF